MDEFPITLPLTYAERSALISVLVGADISTLGTEPLSELLVRLSLLECQPGGCEYCTNSDTNSNESGFHVTWEDER
jgi:hypothetical protein